MGYLDQPHNHFIEQKYPRWALKQIIEFNDIEAGRSRKHVIIYNKS